MTPMISATITIDNINKHQLSDSHFDRHIRTRLDVMDLFLRVAFKAGLELLRAVALVPLATLKWILKKLDRSHLLTASIDFGKITAYLNQSKQCTTALICDFPAIFIDPKTAQTRLLNRQLIRVDIPQPRGAFFVSLAKHLWTHRAASIGTTAAILTTAVAIYRLGFFNPRPNPPPLLPSVAPSIHRPGFVCAIVAIAYYQFDKLFTEDGPYEVGLFYHKRGNSLKAGEYMQVAVDRHNDSRALKYMYTIKYPKSGTKERLFYLQKAARIEDPLAQYILGIDYEEGNGVHQDIKTAIGYYEQAAKQADEDDDMAQEALERLTQQGDGADMAQEALDRLAQQSDQKDFVEDFF